MTKDQLITRAKRLNKLADCATAMGLFVEDGTVYIVRKHKSSIPFCELENFSFKNRQKAQNLITYLGDEFYDWQEEVTDEDETTASTREVGA